MAKNLLKIFFFTIFFLMSPVVFGDTDNINMRDIPGTHEVEISINQSTYVLQGAQGKCFIFTMLQVFAL